MPKPAVLRNLRVKRVSLVDMGANFDPHTGDGAHIMLYKSAARKDSPAPGAVHVDTIIGSDKKKKQKENDVKKSLLKRMLGVFSETDVTKRASAVEDITKAIGDLPDDEDPITDPTDVAKRDLAIKAAVEASALAIQKKHDEEVAVLKASIAASTASVEVEKNLRLDREMTDVLKAFRFAPINLATDVVKFRKMKESNPEEYERVVELLKAADAQLAGSALYKNFGSNLSGGSGDAWTEIETLAKAEVAKNASLSKEQAIEKVMFDPSHVELVKRYRSAQ